MPGTAMPRSRPRSTIAQQRDLTYTYSKEDHDRAQRTYTAWNLDHALADLDAARDAIADAGRIGIIGFCWGGSLAWLSACRGDYACAVSYYGSMIPDLAERAAALSGHLPYRRQGHVTAAGARRDVPRGAAVRAGLHV